MLGLDKPCTDRAFAVASRARSQDIYQRYAAALYRQALLNIDGPALAEYDVCDVLVNESALARVPERGEDDARYRLAQSVLRCYPQLVAGLAQRARGQGRGAAAALAGLPRPRPWARARPGRPRSALTPLISLWRLLVRCILALVNIVNDDRGPRMIDVQLLYSALIALALLVGLATALAIAMVAATAVTRGGSGPRGGTPPDLPDQPTPDNDHARELVLR